MCHHHHTRLLVVHYQWKGMQVNTPKVIEKKSVHPIGVDGTHEVFTFEAGSVIRQVGGFRIPLTKEEAIDAAKVIIEYYDVPFCNRVEGAGREK